MDNLVTNNIEVSHQILTDGIVMDDSSEDPVSHDAIIDTYIPPEPEETTQTQKLSPDEAERGLQGIVQNIESAYAKIESATSDSFVRVSAYANLSISVPSERLQISRMIAESIQKQDMLFWMVSLRGTLKQIASDAGAALKLYDRIPTKQSDFLAHKIECLLSLLDDGFVLYAALSQTDLDQGEAQQDAEFIRETLVTLNQKTHTALAVDWAIVNLQQASLNEYAESPEAYQKITTGFDKFLTQDSEYESLLLDYPEVSDRLHSYDPSYKSSFGIADKFVKVNNIGKRAYTRLAKRLMPMDRAREAEELRLIWSAPKNPENPDDPITHELTQELYTSVIQSHSPAEATMEASILRKILCRELPSLDVEMTAIKSYHILTPKIYTDEANQGLDVMAHFLDQSLKRIMYPENFHRSSEYVQKEVDYFKLTQTVCVRLMNYADTYAVVREARRIRKSYEEVSRFGKFGQELGRNLALIYIKAAPKIDASDEADAGIKFLRQFFEDENLGQQALLAYTALSNDVGQEAAGVEAKALRLFYGSLDNELYGSYLPKLNPLDAAEEAHAHHEVITSSVGHDTEFADTLSTYEICLFQMTQGLFETPALEDEASLLASTDDEAAFLRASLMNEQDPKIYHEGFWLYSILAHQVSELEAASAAEQFRSEIANGSTVDQLFLVDLYARLSPKLSDSELSQGAILFRTKIISDPPLELRHGLANAYSKMISLMPHAAQLAEYDCIRVNFAHVSRIVRETFQTSYELCVGKMPLEIMAVESEKILQGLKHADKNLRETSMDLTMVLYDNMSADLREEHGLKLVKTLDIKDDGLLQNAMTLCEKWFGDLRPQSYTRIAQELRILSADPRENIADNAFAFFKNLFFKLSPDVQANEAKELHAFFGREDARIRNLVVKLYAEWLKTLGPEALRQQANSLFASVDDTTQVWEVKAFLYQKVLPRLMGGGMVLEQTRQLRLVFLSSDCESLVLTRSQEAYLAWIKSLNCECESQETADLRDFIKNPENILKRETAVKAYRELAKTFEPATVQSEMRMMREEYFASPHPDIRTTGLVLYEELAAISPPTSEEKMSAIIVLQEMAKDHVQVVRQAAKSTYDQLVSPQKQERPW